MENFLAFAEGPLYAEIRLLNSQGLPRWLSGKESASQEEMWVRFLGQEDPLEKGMATHCSIHSWRILWTEEPGRLQSVGHTESDTTEVT